MILATSVVNEGFYIPLHACANFEIKKEKVELSPFVPRAGVEPAQVALLVFETSASTDSAIWAASTCSFELNCGAKLNCFFYMTKYI